MTDPEGLKAAAAAGLDELKRAYRKAALAHHPDQNPHPEAARHFRRLTDAYRVLEAQFRLKPQPRVVPLGDRASYLLADVRSLLRRWPAERWSRTVDGLPSAVWVVSALDVLASAWPNGSAVAGTTADVHGVGAAVERLAARLEAPLPSLNRAQKRRLEAVLKAAEDRLRALDRPLRRRQNES